MIAAMLLVNMLIAMMGTTYQIIAERKNEWMRQVFNSFLIYFS
jgi:transient receptor potential cation channel subfamily V protein 5